MQDKGFEIKCLNCGSTNTEIYEDGDYVYDGEDEYWLSCGYKLQCKNCGQEK